MISEVEVLFKTTVVAKSFALRKCLAAKVYLEIVP